MSNAWMIIPWAGAAYLLGALPWSVWLGGLFFRTDPRAQRDHNPGAANAFRAAGWRLGVAVLALDFLKAFIPVAAANWVLRFPGPDLLWIALMPTLGHAFSIFLRFRGGRGIVVMFGVWAGLTLYVGPLALGATAIAGVLLTKNDELRALAVPTVLILFLLVTRASPWLLLVALAQLLVLSAKIGVFLLSQHQQGRKGGQ